MARLKRRIVRTVSELVMGGKRYSRPKWRQKESEKITASRRRLNKIKKETEEIDKRIGQRLKTIDRLHKRLKRKRKTRI